MKTDWHVHSDFSAGENSPKEIVDAAISAGYTAICITDNVRMNSNWLPAFHREIERLKLSRGSFIQMFSAMETKALDFTGALDAREEFFSLVDFTYASVHRIPDGNRFMHSDEISAHPEEALENWRRTILGILDNPRVQVIVHPGRLFRRRGIAIPESIYRPLAEKAARNGVAFEVNTKYRVPDSANLAILLRAGTRLVRGSDAHSIAEMLEYDDESDFHREQFGL